MVTRMTGSAVSTVRPGGERVRVRNSGLEVWVYDEGHLARIRAAVPSGPNQGGAPVNLPRLMGEGLALGYSLDQDDDLDVAIYVGAPLSDAELAVARWLEPQTAFLHVPSGTLCVESNDASRIGSTTPAEQGALVDVPPGDYRVTLYRVDREALFRDEVAWDGPQEILVLTPGGSSADAAPDLLPCEPRRDLTWVGRYRVDGRRADALAWFPDDWDSFVLNLDEAALSALGVRPGTCIRTSVTAANLTMITAVAETWDEARRVRVPAGIQEAGYGALVHMSQWNGAQALLARRERAQGRLEPRHQFRWIPAVVEALDADDMPASPPAARAPMDTDLRKQSYFDGEFLATVLGEVLPDVDDLDTLKLPKALKMLDRELAAMGLTPAGDLSWQEPLQSGVVEASSRIYTGPPDRFAAILARPGSFEVVFLSELDDATWIVTGLADDIGTRSMRRGADGMPQAHPRLLLQSLDEPLSSLAATHEAALASAGREAVRAPLTRAESAAALVRFLAAAFD